MRLDFLHWGMYNKNDKLDALRKVIEDQDKSLRIISQRHDRLLTYYGLTEIDGPRIVEITQP